MDSREPEAEPQFSQPYRQIILMLAACSAVGAGLYLGYPQLRAIFMANAALNGTILALFLLGVLFAFAQVWQLIKSIQWIEAFAAQRVGANLIQAPSLLAPLATLLRSRGARMQISSTSSRSILDSVGQRIDEDREITRYIGNTLIFLGLLGTFYGLATTVPALVETIRSLSADEGGDGASVFGRLQQGLESQLGGMGTAFSSSLLGLAGSLVVGLLELFAGHGQNRFYRELEEWLSSITRLSFAAGEEGGNDADVMGSFVDHLAEQMEAMRGMVATSAEQRSQFDGQMLALTGLLEQMASREDTAEPARDTEMLAALERIARAQEDLAQRIGEDGEGIDAESRMRLRSIDVQLLKILEEMTAGRQETVSELRREMSAMTRALRAGLTRIGGG